LELFSISNETRPLNDGVTAAFGVGFSVLKIASKALVLRSEKKSPKIIDGDQYAYVKGRTTFDAVP